MALARRLIKGLARCHPFLRGKRIFGRKRGNFVPPFPLNHIPLNWRYILEKIKNKIASFLYRLGVSADFLTYAGLLSALGAGVLIAKGYFLWAGGVLLFAGGLDLLDGAVARQAKVLSPFGGILDSTLDRYGDGFVLSGVLFYCLENYYPGYALLTLSAILGSFGVSYVRARAECVVKSCRVGFWERGERLVYLALGLLVGNLPLVLWFLGVGTHLTVVHRLVHAKKTVAGHPDASPKLLGITPAFLSLSTRAQAPYVVKCILLTFLLLFFRLSF